MSLSSKPDALRAARLAGAGPIPIIVGSQPKKKI